MSSKGKKYKKMVPTPKEQEVWECTNPLVVDGTMMCDGNCWMCGYHHLVETIKIFK